MGLRGVVMKPSVIRSLPPLSVISNGHRSGNSTSCPFINVIVLGFSLSSSSVFNCSLEDYLEEGFETCYIVKLANFWCFTTDKTGSLWSAYEFIVPLT